MRCTVPPAVHLRQPITGYVLPHARRRHQAVRRHRRGRRRLLPRRSGPGGRLPRPQRGRQVHHHANDHAVLRARCRHDPARRQPVGEAGREAEAPHRLPPREQPALRRDAGRRVPGLRRPAARARHGPAPARASTRPSSRRASRPSTTGLSASCPRAFASGSGWPRRSCIGPTCWCSTSRPRDSIPISGSRSVGSSVELGQEPDRCSSRPTSCRSRSTSASRLLIINRGRIVADGPVEELVTRAAAARSSRSRPPGTGRASGCAALPGVVRDRADDAGAVGYGYALTASGRDRPAARDLRLAKVGLDARTSCTGGRQPGGSVPGAHRSGRRHEGHLDHRAAELKALFDIPTGYVLLWCSWP